MNQTIWRRCDPRTVDEGANVRGNHVRRQHTADRHAGCPCQRRCRRCGRVADGRLNGRSRLGQDVNIASGDHLRADQRSGRGGRLFRSDVAGQQRVKRIEPCVLRDVADRIERQHHATCGIARLRHAVIGRVDLRRIGCRNVNVTVAVARRCGLDHTVRDRRTRRGQHAVRCDRAVDGQTGAFAKRAAARRLDR